MANPVDALYGKVTDAIRTWTAEDLAALFVQHNLAPWRGAHIRADVDHGASDVQVTACSGVGIVFFAMCPTYALVGEWPVAIEKETDLFSYFSGYEGWRLPDDGDEAMYEKGKRVYELASAAKEQA